MSVIQVQSKAFTKTKTNGYEVLTTATSNALTASGAGTDALGTVALDSSIYTALEKKFLVGVEVIGAGNDVNADFQLQVSIDGTTWTTKNIRSEGTITLTDLPAVDGTVTLVDYLGNAKVYTAKASEDLGARYFNVSGTAATATITFAGLPTLAQTIQIISEDGLSRTYIAHPSSDFTAGVNQFKADVSAADCGAKLKLAIDNAGGHAGKITVVDDGAGGLTLTQATAGADGNRTITENLANTTSTSFTGGEFTSAVTSLAACIAATAGHNGAITTQNDGAGQLTVTQLVAGDVGNTTITDALTNATVVSFTGGSGSAISGVRIANDIQPNVTGDKLYLVDATDIVAPWFRLVVNNTNLNLGSSFTAKFKVAYKKS